MTDDYTPTKDRIVSWLMEGAYTGQGADHRAEAFDAWLAEHDAKVRAEAVRDARDELGVYVGDEDSEWWDGYRNGQRRQNTDMAEYADHIEREAGQK